MNRRQFIRSSVACGASLAFGNVSSWTQASNELSHEKGILKGLRIIDAHAHPDLYTVNSRQVDNTSTLKAITGLGMVASCFAAVGDRVYLSQDRIPGTEYHSTKTQLEWWIKGIVKSGKVKLVLRASDVPNALDSNTSPGAILSIEGADPLKGDSGKLDEFYRLGVRMITLVHYRNNELGDTMKNLRNLDPGLMHHGLTQAGRKVVERMQELGMVVDVAHTHVETLKQIVEMGVKPMVDSHTSPCSVEDPAQCGRFRTWKDMEAVVKGGGVICTWPLAYSRGGTRKTFLDWANEILEMKKRLGMEHVGLGTDGGGNIPSLIEGYKDVRDLIRLVAAMQETGFSSDDIAAYMGGNFHRVLQSSIG